MVNNYDKKTKKLHKKHISTKWGLVLIGLLLISVLITIYGVSKKQTTESFAKVYEDVNSVYKCNKAKGTCPTSGSCFFNAYEVGRCSAKIPCCIKAVRKSCLADIDLRTGKSHERIVSGFCATNTENDREKCLNSGGKPYNSVNNTCGPQCCVFQ